jgi:cytochrome c oxidase subunit IV
MDGYQHAARDFLMVRYALFAVLFALAMVVEGFTRDVGARNTVLWADAIDTKGVVIEVVQQAELDKVIYAYRVKGEEIGREGIFRFEHWRAAHGVDRYEADQQIAVVYSPAFPDVSYPKAELGHSRPDMVVWLLALAAGLALLLSVLWNLFDHVRFARYLRWN